jgi:hypothetical protein
MMGGNGYGARIVKIHAPLTYSIKDLWDNKLSEDVREKTDLGRKEISKIDKKDKEHVQVCDTQ